MRRFAPLLALALALVVSAGCRDTLVDPPGPGPVAPTDPSAPAIYLKGPERLSLNQRGSYRAEQVPGVHHYVWRRSGEGGLELRFYVGDTRVPSALAHAPGTVDLVVLAYDAEGLLIGRGTKTVTIR